MIVDTSSAHAKSPKFSYRADQCTVWVVTTLFDRPNTIKSYLERLNAQRNVRWQLVLVDHGTSPAPLPKAAEDRITVIKEDPEKWWTAATNSGIRYVLAHARDDDCLVLQNDDSDFGPHFLANLVETAVAYNAVVGSVATHRGDGKILHAHLKLNRATGRYDYPFRGAPLQALNEDVYETDALKGRGTAYPISVVRNIGLLDERLPQYKSDHEWSHRAKRFGHTLLVTPEAVCATELDTQIRIHPERPLHTYGQLLFSRRSPRNLRDTIVYSFLSFDPARAIYYALVDSAITILGAGRLALRYAFKGHGTTSKG